MSEKSAAQSSTQMQVIGIQRDERFSPNSVEKDLAILKAVVEPLGGRIVPEARFLAFSEDSENSEDSEISVFLKQSAASLIFSMARLPETLARLRTMKRQGARVLNPAEGVEACQRSRLVEAMQAMNIPQPPAEGPDGYWIKRGDGAAQSKVDVCFCEDATALAKAKEAFRLRGIEDMVVQAHVPGDLVKFYGVEGTGFFRVYYPGDDGQTKFGDEARNGRPQHFAFSEAALKAEADRLAKAVCTPIYGGDAIIRENGSFVLIDFNDWPSFSRCRDDAAAAIRHLAENTGAL